MTKRKPRRKAPQKARQPIGWIWWTAGLLAVGWIVFDANRAIILDHVPQFAMAAKEPQRPAASARPAALSSVQEQRTRSDAARTTASIGSPAKIVAIPPVRMAALPRPPQPAARMPATPTPARPTPGRPLAAAAMPATPQSEKPMPAAPQATTRPGSGGIVTSRRTLLHSAPSAQAPVWATLEAGGPLRITARKGTWRQVEAGIFTGWINAEPTEKQIVPKIAATRPALAKAQPGHPVPPGAIPQRQR